MNDENCCDIRHKPIEIRMDMMDKALELQAKEIDRRLEALNELRSEVTQDRSQFVKLGEHDMKMEQINDFMKQASVDLNTLKIHYSNRITISILVSGLSLIVAIIVLYLRFGLK